MVPRPVLAVLLLFPITDKTEAARREREWAGTGGHGTVLHLSVRLSVRRSLRSVSGCTTCQKKLLRQG